MNRANFQALARARIGEAKILLDQGGYAGAYYLAGYAVEFALKSCILAYIERTGIIFVKKKFAENCWTHNLDDLVDLADLTSQKDRDINANVNLFTNWGIVTTWNETSRYELKTQAEAEALYHAITHNTDGVLQWLQPHW